MYQLSFPVEGAAIARANYRITGADYRVVELVKEEWAHWPLLEHAILHDMD